jgi:peroxiredoxin
MNKIKLFLVGAAMIFSSILLQAEIPSINDEAPDFTLTDSKGITHSLSDFRGKYVVLEWINVECPFVKKHYEGKNMQMLQKKYTDEDVVWLSICSSADGKQGNLDNNTINSKLSAWGAFMTAYLIDESGSTGKAYGAKTTPDIRIITPEGKIAYIGAIDDTPSTKIEDIPNSINYLDKAMQALMNGNEVDPKITKPYGCSVKY